jgi:membrane protein
MPPKQSIRSKITQFFSTDIWRAGRGEISKPRAAVLHAAQMLLLAVRGYVRDNCDLRASSLTFFSLLSVVPVMALIFGISKGFGLEARLENQLYQRLAGQEEVVARIIRFARTLLENTQGELIAGIGVLFLFWAAIRVLGHIEAALNEIWKVPSRSFIRKFTDYLAIMIISPLLVVMSSSVTVYITTQVTAMTSKVAVLEIADPLIFSLLKLLPFGLIWLLFILIYLVMPHTRVRPVSALIGGLIAGTIFQILQGAYIHTQVLLSQYNAIYGSFAALPFFLIWLQLSWTIVLFGAQIAYAHQHMGQHLLRMDFQDISLHFKKRLAAFMLRRIIENFQNGQPPLTAEEIAGQLKLPHGLVVEEINHLIRGGMVSAIADPQREEPAYQPARDIHGIRLAQVLAALDKAGRNDLPDSADRPLRRIDQAVEALEAAANQSSANLLVKDI